MLKLEKNKTYNLKLLPNIDDPKNSVIGIKYKLNNVDSFRTSSKYFCYYLTEENKVDVIVFGEQIKSYIRNCINGFYGTTEGYFITNEDKPLCYYTNDDNSIIVSENDYEQYRHLMNLVKKTDIAHYDKILLYDIKSPFLLTCKTREKSGFLQIYNIGLTQNKPLWVDGDDKNIIYDLYSDVEKITDTVELYKMTYLTKTDILFV